VLLVSGDRTAEVSDLARRVGIDEVHGGTSPEGEGRDRPDGDREGPDALRRGRDQRRSGDRGGDRRPRLRRGSDITAEAAGAVLLDPSLVKVDELFHVARRLRRVALQSAGFGMALSIGGMGLAAAGHLSPVAGAVFQEIIDVLAIANALRAGTSPVKLHDFEG
jgi:cation transport ATPase